MYISDLISPNQVAFLKGRLNSDCVLLAHELVRDFNIPTQKQICLKVDIRKAFDTVNREYITHFMGFHSLGLGMYIFFILLLPHWWLSLRVFTSNWGIWWGDPLSPYLFVLVIGDFSIKLALLVAERSVKHIKRLHFISPSHLLFGNDLLVFWHADNWSPRHMDLLLKQCEIMQAWESTRRKVEYFVVWIALLMLHFLGD